MASGRSPLFRSSVDKLFENWTALKLAVENGQGGAHGKEIAIWMRGAVEDFFYQNDDLMGDEVAEFIDTLMDQELDTIVDDNSSAELGASLCLHFRLSKDPTKIAELGQLHSALDAAAVAAAAQSPPKHVAQPSQDDDSDSEQDMDEEMETDEPTNESPSSSNHNPNQQRSGHNIVTPPDEDGWVTVVKSKKH